MDPALFKLISDAYRWFDDLRTGRAATIAEIAKRESVQVSHVSRTLLLAFLAPDIVEMVAAGRQPFGLTVERLDKRRTPLPMEWATQRNMWVRRLPAASALEREPDFSRTNLRVR